MLMFSMCFMGVAPLNVQAIEDEKIESEETDKVKFVAEDGSIIEQDVEDGTIDVDNVEEQSLARSVRGVQVVNLNTGSGTLSFKDVNTGQDGYVSKSYGADAAYLGTNNGKVRFMISGVVGEVDENQVQVVSNDEVHVSYYYGSNGTLYHYIATNMNKEPTTATKVGNVPSFMKQGVRYYSYD